MRSGIEVIRDAGYAVPFTVLLGVIALSAALARAPSAQTTPAPDASAPATAPVTVPDVATQTPPAQSAGDARRTADLATLSDLLETYRSRHGAYPTTESYTMTVCTSGWDPGCLLTSLSSHLPASDGSHPYWYRSDGATYTLFALVDAPPARDDCPPPLPPTLSGGPVLCVSSPGGVR